jgi:Fe-S-cluster containining protein
MEELVMAPTIRERWAELNWQVEPSIPVCSDACGATCCRLAGGQVAGVFMDDAERKALRARGREFDRPVLTHWAPKRVGDTAPWLLSFAAHGGACPMLDQRSNRCLAHAVRPGACRTFPQSPTAGCLVWPAATTKGDQS